MLTSGRFKNWHTNGISSSLISNSAINNVLFCKSGITRLGNFELTILLFLGVQTVS
jgi:hypothetical protein